MAVPQKWFYAAVEAAAGCEAHPLGVPEGVAPPFVVYGRSATTRELVLSDTLQEEPAADVLPPVGTFQVQIYADGYLAAWEIADAIRAALHKFAGTVDGIEIEACLLAEEADGDPVFLEGRDKPTYVVDQVYTVRWID
jgi:hypothetical protein